MGTNQSAYSRKMNKIHDRINSNDPRIYTANLAQEFYDSISKGTKTVEGRINRDEKFPFVLPGDIVKWRSPLGDIAETRIIFVHRYRSFYQMLQEEGLKNVLPGYEFEEGIRDVYYHFYGKENDIEDEKKYGVVAFGLQIIREE